MSLSGRDDTVVVDTTDWRGEHQARGAEEKYMTEAPEAPVLTQECLRSLEGRNPMAAALLSVVSRKVYSVFSTVFLLLLLLAVAVGCPAACFGR